MYVAIFDACLDGDHNACPEKDPVQGGTADAVVCGGGQCICECHALWHGDPNLLWIEDVRQHSLQSRAAREHT